jgi:hypothetical protein
MEDFLSDGNASWNPACKTLGLAVPDSPPDGLVGARLGDARGEPLEAMT